MNLFSPRGFGALKGFVDTVADEQRILSFIDASFRSVWAIEILRFLAERREYAHSPDELISELRVSNAVIVQSVAQLEAVALVVVEELRMIRFQPASEELDSLAREAIALYDRRPDQVRRTIVSRTSPGITAFSDAFRLRKD